jgi:hypothetical protein
MLNARMTIWGIKPQKQTDFWEREGEAPALAENTPTTELSLRRVSLKK